MVNNKFLFNFSVSYSGGGLKRLYAYAEWFNRNGGAYFIIHPNCAFLIEHFKNNYFFIVKQSKIKRLLIDHAYLKNIHAKIGIPELYYSYGIPPYIKFGKLNWFHISNVLPFNFRNCSLPKIDEFKFYLLGKRIRNNLKNSDIVSAESHYSLSLLPPVDGLNTVVSVNGSDEEIEFANLEMPVTDNIAVIVGTYYYKALYDSFQVFQMLKKQHKDLKLVIIGNKEKVPPNISKNEHVVLTGNIERAQVFNFLKKARFYISTTLIENSYNAASEGIFLAKESFISNIGPHQELLANLTFQAISLPNVRMELLHVKKENMSTVNLKKWDTVITEMIKCTDLTVKT